MNEILPDRTLSSLFGELSRETSTLFRQEINLAKAEVSEKVSQATMGAVWVVVGGVVLFAAFLGLMFCAAAALSSVIALWLAALIVSVVVAIAGGIVLGRGLADLKGENLKPNKTMDTLRANARWAKEQLR